MRFSNETSEVEVGKALDSEEGNVANLQRLPNFEDLDLKIELTQGINDYGCVYLMLVTQMRY